MSGTKFNGDGVRKFRFFNRVFLIKPRVMHQPFPPYIRTFIAVAVGLIPAFVFGQIRWEPYPGPIDASLEGKYQFGYLTVPESRHSPQSRDIQIAFTLLKSTSENPASDAVLFLPGGPGAGYSQIAGYAFSVPFIQELLAERDVILFDPRGCGYSQPTLCDAFNQPEFRFGSIGKEGAEAEAFMIAAVSACADTLATHQVDILAYNSIEVAKDVEALRQALGYTQWNLRGHSYGTKFAQTVMQRYPASIRSAILTGVVDPISDEIYHTYPLMYGALSKLLTACEADPTCHEAYPTLAQDLPLLIKRLESKPIKVPDYVTAEVLAEPLYVTPSTITAAIHTLMYNQDGLEALPALLHVLAQEEDWVVAAMTSPLLHEFDEVDQDMAMIISSNDYPPRQDTASTLKEDHLATLLQPHFDQNNALDGRTYWDMITTERIMDTVTMASFQKPVLLISGEFDPITPPHLAESVLPYYPNAQHWVIPGRGHDGGSAANALQAAFIQRPEAPLDSQFLASIPAMQFLTDITYNPGISAAMAHLSSKRYGRFVALGIFALLSLFGFLFFPARGLIQLVQQKPLAYVPSGWVWLACLLTVAVLGSYGLAISDSLSTNPYLLAIGLPAAYNWIQGMVWTLLGTLMLALFFTVRTWKQAPSKIALLSGLIGSLGVGGFVVLTGIL